MGNSQGQSESLGDQDGMGFKINRAPGDLEAGRGRLAQRGINKGKLAYDHWKSVVDNIFIEFLASLFIIMSAVMYGGEASEMVFADPWTQIIPAVTICGVMLCLKDGDCFFPDATPSVTILMWAVGGYDHWLQPLARIGGQTLAAGVVLWMCHDIAVPSFGSAGRPPAVIFAFEMTSTTIEHMGAVYLFIPMLPAVSHGRVRAKHHHETLAPALQDVMHAALAFAGIHWALRLSFMSEMNPLATIVRHTLWNQGWEECTMAIWGQGVCVLVALIYIVNYYSPRKQRPYQ